VVTLSEGYGGKEVETGTYRAMVADVRQALAPFEARHDLAAPAAAGRVQMLGTSGTVTTLVGLHKRLPRYDRSRVDGVHLTSACRATTAAGSTGSICASGRSAR
jgi:exopolyphosphatase/guanosine-5'-triphosphate,3'-diphosphate pyrophosphatase